MRDETGQAKNREELVRRQGQELATVHSACSKLCWRTALVARPVLDWSLVLMVVLGTWSASQPCRQGRTSKDDPTRGDCVQRFQSCGQFQNFNVIVLLSLPQM